MMSIGQCTQRKPRICGNPCLVVPFVPKLLAQQIYLSFKMVDLNTEAPWGNGSKEWSDCKKNMGHVRHFSHRDPATVCSNSRVLPPRVLWWLRHEPPGGLLNTLGLFWTSLWLPGAGYWFYTNSQFMKLADFTVFVAAYFPITTDSAYS